MNSPDAEDFTLELDQANGVIRLRAAGTFGDPVELSADAARELGQSLIRLADELE
jgi:hypothetical protein